MLNTMENARSIIICVLIATAALIFLALGDYEVAEEWHLPLLLIFSAVFIRLAHPSIKRHVATLVSVIAATGDEDDATDVGTAPQGRTRGKRSKQP